MLKRLNKALSAFRKAYYSGERNGRAMWFASSETPYTIKQPVCAIAYWIGTKVGYYESGL